MPKFIDYHESLPPMPPEMMAQAKAGIEAGAVNEFGGKGLNLFLGTDGSAYCLSEAPSADAVSSLTLHCVHTTESAPATRNERAVLWMPSERRSLPFPVSQADRNTSCASSLKLPSSRRLSGPVLPSTAFGVSVNTSPENHGYSVSKYP